MCVLDDPVLFAYANMNRLRSTAKDDIDATCWNWALHGMGSTQAPDPRVLFQYVAEETDGLETREEAREALSANQGHEWHNLQPDMPLRTELDVIRQLNDSEEHGTQPEHIDTVRDRVFELAIKAAGFTLSSEPTSYLICMFEPSNVVMYDHWWLEIEGAVVETIASRDLFAYSDRFLGPAFNHPRDRYEQRHDGSGLEAEMQSRVHARYVAALKPEQKNYLERLLSPACSWCSLF